MDWTSVETAWHEWHTAHIQIRKKSGAFSVDDMRRYIDAIKSRLEVEEKKAGYGIATVTTTDNTSSQIHPMMARPNELWRDYYAADTQNYGATHIGLAVGSDGRLYHQRKDGQLVPYGEGAGPQV